MMPRIERIQYPVGQGGFFAEHHSYNQRTVVYDCGSGRSPHPPQLLKDQCEAFGSATDRIDALIISHFHCDHINGIDTLMKIARNGAKRVFMPYLTDDEQILVTIEALAEMMAEQGPEIAQAGVDLLLPWTRGRGQNQRLVEDRGWTIVEIESSEVTDNPEAVSPSYIGDAGNNSIQRMSDRTPISLFREHYSPWNDWILKFFNKKADAEAVRQCLRKLRSIDNFDPSWLDGNHTSLIKWMRKRGNLKKIQVAYAAISAKVECHNLVSLCCYSGPSDDSRWHWHGHSIIPAQWPIPANLERREPHRIGWLGTGDLGLKNTNTLAEFQRHYANVSPHVGVIQIPHHGSEHNSDHRLFANAPMIATVAYGTNNDYHHPDGRVIMGAQRLGITVWPVTEQPETTFRQSIWI